MIPHPGGAPAPTAHMSLLYGYGLVTAAGAAGLGAKVAIIERSLMGGDCLNVGCVPSKGVISAARAAAAVRNASEFGVHVPEGVQVDFAAAMQRMPTTLALTVVTAARSKITEAMGARLRNDLLAIDAAEKALKEAQQSGAATYNAEEYAKLEGSLTALIGPIRYSSTSL